MNDSDNNPDNENGLFKANFTKPSSHDLTSNSYKPFINCIDSNDNNGVLNTNNLQGLDISKQSSSYEPLNEEELLLFKSYEQEEQEVNPKNIEVTNLDTSFSDHDKMTTGIIDTKVNDNNITKLPVNDRPRQSNNNLLAPQSKINSNNKNTGILFGKQISSGKLLMVGIVAGLILSAVIMMLLNTIGILSIAENYLASDSFHSSKAMTVSMPITNTEQSASINLGKNKATASSTEVQAVLEPVTNRNLSINTASTSIDNSSVSNAFDKTNLRQKSTPTRQIKEESSITYEDFREEAQNTLYREDKN